MEITSIQKNIHNSPRKIRLVVDMVRHMKPSVAISQLQFTNKAAALPISKAIKTVLGNAKAQNLDINEMIFKSIEVNEGGRMKRFRPGTKGRAKPYVKRMSHLKIILTNEIKQEKIVTKGDKSKETK
ncbi:MAG: 50S ribosomal protein L22 [Candidatus Daviesbacteria bacterium]|nr:50S ribosomal protein L22 [Candidatus Daviesbacteria bacterium]